MTPARAVAALGAALALTTAGFTAPAHAEPPDNDGAADAIPITSVPSVVEADTRPATFDHVARECVFGRSVWYRYVPEQTSRVRFSTVGSTFDPVLAVYSGIRSPRSAVACNDDAVALQSAVRPRLTAGQQYWIAVSSCCGSRRSRGGDMMLNVYPDPAPPAELAIDVTRATTGAVSGRLRVYGTAACATPSLASFHISASQRAEGAVARGAGSRFLRRCTPEPVEWSMRIDTETGWAFQPGTFALAVRAFADDGFARDRNVRETIMDVTSDPLGRAAR